jgi:hypothetical protein
MRFLATNFNFLMQTTLRALFFLRKFVCGSRDSSACESDASKIASFGAALAARSPRHGAYAACEENFWQLRDGMPAS